MKLKMILSLLISSLLSVDVSSQEGSNSVSRKSFMIVPLVGYTNSAGVQFGVLGSTFYRLNRNDTVSPVSQTGGAVSYSTKKNFYFVAFQTLFWNNDKNRLTVAAGVAAVNFQFYDEDLGGIYIPYNTSTDFVFAQYQHSVFDNLYAGVFASFVHTKTEFETETGTETEGGNFLGPGVAITYDSRDNIYSAGKGIKASVKSSLSRTGLGSAANYENTDISGNFYHTFKNSGIVSASRMALALATGDVPFQSLNIVGGKDIRGYTKGTYRGKQKYTVQSELRYSFHRRIGVVAFAGIAVTSNNGLDTSPLLPAGGAGLRYLMLVKERIKTGVDFAVGKHDWGIYFRLGEAF